MQGQEELQSQELSSCLFQKLLIFAHSRAANY